MSPMDERPSENGAPVALLEDVGKRYVKYEDTPTLLSGVMRFGRRTRRGRLWASRHVNLEVGPGETVGVIGRNGSGKSTLLAMTAGVTAPTEGRIVVRGRVAPLISVGVGFDPELTGRENVYVNATVLGLSRAEIDGLFDDIVDFSEIRDFIDTPVKFYSSGMFVRLGFSVAVASRPDLFLIDEVLAVGDVAFQAKCFERMTEMQEQGTALLVVSHNLAAIRNLCDRVLVLHDGTPRFEGPTDEAISVYHELLQSAGEEDGEPGPVEILDFGVLGSEGGPTSYVETDEEAVFRLRVRFRHAVEQPHFAIRLTTQSGQLVYADGTPALGETRTFAAGEEVAWDARVRLPLATGTYSVVWGVRWGKEPGDYVGAGPHSFYVSGGQRAKGIIDLAAAFSFADGSAEGPPEPSV